MEIHFTPEEEALLSKIASHAGADPEQMVKNAALRLLEEDTFNADYPSSQARP